MRDDRPQRPAVDGRQLPAQRAYGGLELRLPPALRRPLELLQIFATTVLATHAVLPPDLLVVRPGAVFVREHLKEIEKTDDAFLPDSRWHGPPPSPSGKLLQPYQ